MDEATARLGHYRAHNQHMYGGPNAHVLHFPVAKQNLMNVVAFLTDLNDWPLERSMSQPATKDEIAGAFADWGPTVRNVIDLLPIEMEKWGVFDSLDYPAPTYSRGRVCIAGDAAHASSPHHGAGAGIGVEDALALTVLVDTVQSSIRTRDVRKTLALQAAFAAFTAVRRERSQWLVQSSREACEIYEWNDCHCGSDMDKGYEEIKRRSHKIWYFDIEGMLKQLEQEYRHYLAR
jgi:salicylate hydroxylase